MAKKATPYDDLDLEVWQHFAHMEPKEFSSIPPSGLIKPIPVYAVPPYPWNYDERSVRSISHRYRSAFRPVAKRYRGSGGQWAEVSDMTYLKADCRRAAFRRPLEQVRQTQEEDLCREHTEDFETLAIHHGGKKPEPSDFRSGRYGAREQIEYNGNAEKKSRFAHERRNECVELDTLSGEVSPRTMFVSPASFDKESVRSDRASFCSVDGDDTVSQDGGLPVKQYTNQGPSLVGRLRTFFNTLVKG